MPDPLSGYEDLASTPGAVGDVVRQKIDFPALGTETPTDTAQRQMRDVQKKARVQRYRTADLAARDIPSYTDEAGTVQPVTDASGAPLTNFDKKHKIAYDSAGNPQKLEYGASGPPRTVDPLAGLTAETDPKTGDQYLKPAGLKWEHVGVDEKIAAEVKAKEIDKALRETSTALGRKLSLDEHEVAKGGVELKHSATALSTAIPALGMPENADADLPNAQKLIKAHFDEKVKAAQPSTFASWLGGTPDAAAISQIEEERKQALAKAAAVYGLKDRLTATKSRIEAQRATAQAIADARLQSAMSKLGIDGQPATSAPQTASAKEDGAKTPLISAHSSGGITLDAARPFDALQQAKQTGVAATPEMEHRAWTEQAINEAKAGKKAYGMTSDGVFVMNEQKPAESLQEAMNDGVLTEPPKDLIRAAQIKQRALTLDAVERAPLTFFDKLKDVKDRPIQLAPFLSGASDIDQMVRLSQEANVVRDFIEKGEEPPREFIEHLEEYYARQKRDTTFGYKVGAVLSALPSFAGELLLTGGIYTAAEKAALNGGAKALEYFGSKAGADVLAKVLERNAKKAAGEVVEHTVGTGAKELALELGARSAGALAGSAAQTIPSSGLRIAADTVQRMTPQIKVGEDEAGHLNAIISKEGDDFAPAMAKAFGNQFIEVMSEHSGGALAFVPGMKRVEALKAAIVSKWLGAHAADGVPGLRKLLANAGWNGVLGEMFEERVGDAAKSAVGLQSWAEAVPSLEQLAVEAVSFSIPGAAFTAAGAISGRGDAGAAPGPIVTAPAAPQPPASTPPAAPTPIAPTDNSVVAPPDDATSPAPSAPATTPPSGKGSKAPPAAPPKAAPVEPLSQTTVDASEQPTPSAPLASTFPAGTVIANGDDEIHIGHEGKALTWQGVRGGQIVATGQATSMRAATQAGKAALDAIPQAPAPAESQTAGQPSGASGGSAPVGSATSSETEVSAPKKSSTQVTLPEADAKQFRTFAKSIPDAAVYKPETQDQPGGYGRELEPHVTALYGLTTDDTEAVRVAVAKGGHGPVKVKLGKLSLFTNNPEYDVLKVDVESPHLHALNKTLRGLPFDNDYPDYHPHLTVAYLKKGAGAKYAGSKAFEGKEITIPSLTFSDRTRTKTEIPLAEQKPAPAKPAATPAEPKFTGHEAKAIADKLAAESKHPIHIGQTSNESGFQFDTGSAKIVIEPAKAAKSINEARRIAKANGLPETSHEEAMQTFIRHEVWHAADNEVAKSKGKTLEQFYNEVPDSEFPADWNDWGMKWRGDWEKMPKWKRKAEFVAGVAQGEYDGKIPESIWKKVREVLEYLRNLARNGSEWLKSHVADLEKRVNGAKTEAPIVEPKAVEKSGKRPISEAPKSGKKLDPAQQAIKDALGDLLDADAPNDSDLAAKPLVRIVRSSTDFTDRASAEKNALAHVRQPVENRDTADQIHIGGRAISKALSDSAIRKSDNAAAHINAVASVRELLEEAIRGDEHPDKNADQNIKSVARYFAPFEHRGVLYRVKLTAKRTVHHGNRFYTYELAENEAPSVKRVDASPENGLTSTPPEGTISVRDMLAGATRNDGTPFFKRLDADAPKAAIYDSPIPKDRRENVNKLAAALIDEHGVNTPAKLAAKLEGMGPKAQAFSQAIWFKMKSENAVGPAEPDWTAIYGALQPAEEVAPAGTEAPATAQQNAKVADGVRKMLLDGVTITRVELARLNPGDMTPKQLDEATELGITLAGRNIMAKGGTPEETFDRALDVYNRQPNLTAKTSTSKINQAYSTPLPLSVVADVLAKVTKDDVVMDTSAGNGMLMIGANPTKAIVNELNPDRVAQLKIQGFRPTQEDATKFTPDRQPTKIKINPPFGAVKGENGEWLEWPLAGTDDTTREIDHAIVMRSLESLPQNGRAVLIIGGSQAQEPDAREKHYASRLKFFGPLYEKYRVIDHFTVDGDLYKKQGAGWPVDVIVISGRGKSPIQLPNANAPRILRSWHELRSELSRSDADRIKAGRYDAAADSAKLGDQLAGVRAAATGSSGERPAQSGNTAKPAGQRGEEPSSGEIRKPVGDVPIADAAAGDATTLRTNGSGSGGGDLGRGDESVERPRRLPVEAQPQAFHSPYIPVSTGPSFGVETPVNMADAQNEALKAMEKAVGKPLAEYVREKLGYGAKVDLGKHFAAEQLDAIAQAVYQIENNGALIVGDQTGMGKGRIVAGLIKYAQNIGKVPIFVTNDPKLYSAMLGDIDAIGHNTNPLFTNSSIALDHPVTEEVIKQTPGPTKAKIKHIQETGTLPEGYDVLFTTYDQIGKDYDPKEGSDARAKLVADGKLPLDGERTKALRKLAPNALFLLDESHKAAGSSLQGLRVIDLIKNAPVYYSSATFAKRPDSMPLYFKTNLARAAGHGSLADIFGSGDVVMQQVASAMLAKDGQYIRRERTYDGVPFATNIIRTNEDRDSALADEYTSGLRTLMGISNRLKETVKRMNKILSRMGKQMDIPALKLESSDFASGVHNFVSQYLLAIKAESVAVEAISAIKEGKAHPSPSDAVKKFKVIVAVQNTMESPIQDLVAANLPLNYNSLLLRALEKLRHIKTGKGEEGFYIGRTPNPKYADLSESELQSQLSEVKTDAEGNETITVREDVAQELFRRIANEQFLDAERQIDEVDLGDMPLSPIDHIRQRAKAAGIKTGEITGRSIGVDENGELYERDPKDTTKKGQLAALKLFNNSDVDLLIINGSGSTGISAHASKDFKRQDPRLMLVAQPHLDINEFMQTLGRIFRSGQVEKPAYQLIQSALPAEKRPAAILGKKMASLNANTTSNTESQVASGAKVHDLFNEYGDEMVWNYLAANPRFAEDLQWIKLHEIDRNGNRSLRTLQELLALFEGEDGKLARGVASYAAILPVEDQEAFWDKVAADYESLIQYLDGIGENKLKATSEDLGAETISRKEYTAGNPAGKSEFDKPSHLETVRIRPSTKPLSIEDVAGDATKALRGRQEVLKQFTDSARKAIDEAVEKRKKKSITVDVEGRERSRLSAQQADIYAALYLLGERVKIKGSTGESYGAVLGYELDPENPLTPSKQHLIVATNTLRQKIKVPASQANERLSRMDGDGWREQFEATREDKAERQIITGNLVAAAAQLDGKGRVVVYTKSDGTTGQGILLPADYKQGRVITPVSDRGEAKRLLNDGKRLTAEGGTIRVYEKDGAAVLDVPASKAAGGKYWQDRSLNALMINGEFEQKGSWMRGKVASIDGLLAWMDDRKLQLGYEKEPDANSQLDAAAPRATSFSNNFDEEDPSTWGRFATPEVKKLWPLYDETLGEPLAKDASAHAGEWPDSAPETLAANRLEERIMQLDDPQKINFSTAQLEQLRAKVNAKIAEAKRIVESARDAAGERADNILSHEVDRQITAKGAQTLDAAPVRAFIDEDMKPVLETAKMGFQELTGFIPKILNPISRVESIGGDAAMTYKGIQDERAFIVEKTFQAAEKMFAKMQRPEQVAFIDAIKRGEQQPNATLQGVADMMGQIDADNWQRIHDAQIALGQKEENTIKWKRDHYRVMWKTIPGTLQEKINAGAMGRGPLSGSKGFLKHATLADMSEGLEMGGVPYSFNPVSMAKRAWADQWKLEAALGLFKWMKDNSFVVFAKGSPHPKLPEGYQWVEDPLFQRYFPAASGEGLVSPGRYAVETNMARLLKNWLSKDWIRESALGKGLMWMKNVTTAAELGLSPFHFMFETFEMMGSSIGLGLQKVFNRGFLHGDTKALVDGLMDVIGSPASPKTTWTLGKNAERLMTEQGFASTDAGRKFLKQFPNASHVLHLAFLGGAKLDSPEWKIGTLNTFAENLNQNNWIGATLRVLPAFNEMLMKPLFEWYIPRLKLGLFMREMSNALVENSNKISSRQVSEVTLARQVWGFVEDRFGETNFDNLFWNRTFKAAAQLMFRSVTWKMGSIRAIGGAAMGQGEEFVNAIKSGRAPQLHRNMAWFLGLCVVTAALSTILMRVFANRNPESLKDLVYPRIDPKDDHVRVGLPTYVKDLVHLQHSPKQFITSSMAGWIGRVHDIWVNQDFFGTKVRNEDDPLLTQAADVAKYGSEIFMPFTVRGYQNLSDQDVNGVRKALAMLAFNPAPKHVTQSPAEQKAKEYRHDMMPVGGRTKEQSDKGRAISFATTQMRKGEPISSTTMGRKLTLQDLQTVTKRAALTPLQADVKSLSLERAEKVYAQASPNEKAQLAQIMANKRASASKKSGPAMFTSFE